MYVLVDVFQLKVCVISSLRNFEWTEMWQILLEFSQSVSCLWTVWSSIGSYL